MLNSKFKVKEYFSRLKKPYASDANWLWRFLRNREKILFYKIVQDLNKQTCLDLGAGSCEYSKILLNMGTEHSVCVDFSSSLMLEEDNPGIEKIPYDVESFETDQKYDLILCLGILEFLDQPKNFIMRLKLFLKPEGKIILLLPISMIASYIYMFSYLLKGIFIHPLTLKKINCFLDSKGFLLEKTVTAGIFSGFSVYSIQQKNLVIIC